MGFGYAGEHAESIKTWHFNAETSCRVSVAGASHLTHSRCADKLAYREDLGGSLGDEELEESVEELASKIEQLKQLVSP